MNTKHQTMHLQLLNPSSHSNSQSALGTETERGSAFQKRLVRCTNRRLVLLCLGLALLPYGARSDLVSMDDPQFGPGTVTLDTRTGLQWLDLPLSLGMSYDYASSLMAPGGLFAGYRHATSPEVESLFVSAGIPYIGHGGQSSSSNNAPALSLLSLIGSTFSQNGYPGALGYTSSTTYAPNFRDYEVLYCTLVDGVPEFVAGLGGGSISSTSNPSYGQWLVAIPEPSGVCFLAWGLLAMVFRRALRFRRSAG
jgi:hypothetical protein